MKNPFRKRWEVYMVRRDNGKEHPTIPMLRSSYRFWRNDSAWLFAVAGTRQSQYLDYHVRQLP